MKRLLILILVSLGFLSCVACEPEITVTPPVQTPGTIHLEGDSVSTLTYYNNGVEPFFTTGEFVPGSSAAFNPAGEPAMDRVPRLVTQGKVDTLVWALGPNDIRLAKGVWAVKDQWIWYDVLHNKVPAESCIVIAKPWVLPAGWATFPEKALNDLSAWIDAFAEDHQNVVVVDWRPIIEAHPEYMHADGVHIANHEAAVARDAMYRDGVSRCAEG